MKKSYKIIAVFLVLSILSLVIYVGGSFVHTIKKGLTSSNTNSENVYYPTTENDDVDIGIKEGDLFYGARHLSENLREEYEVVKIDYEKEVIIIREIETKEVITATFDEHIERIKEKVNEIMNMTPNKERESLLMLVAASQTYNDKNIYNDENIKKIKSDNWYCYSVFISSVSGIHPDEIYEYIQTKEGFVKCFVWAFLSKGVGVEDYAIHKNGISYTAQTTAKKDYHNKYFNYIVINADKSVILHTSKTFLVMKQDDFLTFCDEGLKELYGRTKLENNPEYAKELLLKYEANHSDTYKFKAEDAERLSYDSLFYAALLFSSVSDVPFYDLYDYMQTDDGKMEMCAIFIYGHNFPIKNVSDTKQNI